MTISSRDMKVLTTGALLHLALISIASAVPIYGGPTYDPSTQTGFMNPMMSSPPGGSYAGDGMGIVNTTKSNSGMTVGSRAFRFDNSGNAAIELGNLGTSSLGSAFNVVYSMNTSGTISGYSTKYDSSGSYFGYRAVRWDTTNVPLPLDDIGLSSSGSTSAIAYSINQDGGSAGFAEAWNGAADLGPRAVRWAATGTAATRLDDLGTSGGVTDSRGYSINKDGTVVGYANKYDGTTLLGQRAVRWDAGGHAATPLDTLPARSTDGFTNSIANAVNKNGTAVGFSTLYSGTTSLGSRAARWDANGTAVTPLDDDGTSSTGSTSSVAVAINSDGTSVGMASKYDAGHTYLGIRAIRWDATGTSRTELGVLGTNSGGITNSNAFAINTAGNMVGQADFYTNGTKNGTHAVAWGSDAVAIDLNSLLSSADAANWTLTNAYSISDTNWVTGVGTFDPDGPTGALASYSRAFLIQVNVPEPMSTAMLALGGLTLLRRRSRN